MPRKLNSEKPQTEIVDRDKCAEAPADAPAQLECPADPVEIKSSYAPFVFAFALVFVLVFVFTYRDSLMAEVGGAIQLQGDELKQARAIAIDRQQINFERQAVGNEFQAKMNRLAEREADLNVEASKLCFELKKAHSLRPNAKYLLDEWGGKLEKQ